MRITSSPIQISDIGLGIIILSYLLLVFSSPMPINIGVIEILMGAGLTIGALLILRSHFVLKDKDLILPALCIAYFLLVPLLVGLVRGNDHSDISRDIAPLMFMVMLPFLVTYLPHDNNSPYRLRALLFAILAVGLVSAVEFHHGMMRLYGSMDMYLPKQNPILAAPEHGIWKPISFLLRFFEIENTDFRSLVVKLQDPALLFSAIYLLCRGLELTLVKPRHVLLGLLALGAGIFCTYEIAVLVMRAFVGLTALAIIIYVLHLCTTRKLPVWKIILAGVLSLILTHTHLEHVKHQLLAKHQFVGLNGKVSELYAVLVTNSENLMSLLFGSGWGGVVSNPIYGGEFTRFTHSLISYWFFKTGIVGFAIMVYFVILLLRRSNLKGIWTSSHRLAVVLAASAVIIIALFFEPTYKMLSFGMIVGLLFAEFSLSTVPDHKYKVAQNSV